MKEPDTERCEPEPEEPTDRHDNTAPADTMGAPVVGGVDPAAGRKRGRPPDEPDERAAERPKRNIATRVEGAYNQLPGKRAPPPGGGGKMAPNSNTKKKTDGQQAPSSGGALKRALAVGSRLLDIIEPAWRNSDA